MEANLEQSVEIDSLETVKAMVQRDNNRKEVILKGRAVEVLSAYELDDIKKMSAVYKSAVERNNEVVDFIMDVKNDILKIRLAKDRLDKTTSLYFQQATQIDYYIKILTEILGIVKEEQQKLDRVVRFYEKNYNTYSF